VASGTFVATGQNKPVQHLEGGIIREVLVREGDMVEAGQVLARLDETAAVAKLRRLVLRNYRLHLMQARLEAELKSSEAFAMPAALSADASDPEVQRLYARQLTELRVRRARYADEEEVLRKEIAGLHERISGYDAQRQSMQRRLDLFAEELKDKKSLLDRQLSRKTEVLAIQRAEAGISGEMGDIIGRIADASERVARAEQQIAQLHSARLQKVTEELRATESELDDVHEQIRAARDVVDRIEVRAPVRGAVIKLHAHTPGAVIAPGATIAELLPVGEELIIEARINPSDIAHVKRGQDASIRLTALNQRTTPTVEGQVIYVSADTVYEQETRRPGEAPNPRQQSYIARIRLDTRDAAAKVAEFRPLPGMPADVYVKTGERTFFHYMLRPVLDSLTRAFREP
jgi:HlyD family secretion protein